MLGLAALAVYVRVHLQRSHIRFLLNVATEVSTAHLWARASPGTPGLFLSFPELWRGLWRWWGPLRSSAGNGGA
jgi:hypothetical protein